MKHTFFYYSLLTIWICIHLLSCSTDDENDFSFGDAVVNNSSEREFNQLIFILNIKNISDEFICMERIDSVRLQVNGNPWGVFSSEPIENEARIDFEKDNISWSVSPVNYLVIAPYMKKKTYIETAGDAIEYLNGVLELQPGDYICEITEIKLKDKLGDWIKIRPFVFQNFTVRENTVSSYLGDISVRWK